MSGTVDQNIIQKIFAACEILVLLSVNLLLVRKCLCCAVYCLVFGKMSLSVVHLFTLVSKNVLSVVHFFLHRGIARNVLSIPLYVWYMWRN